MYSDLKDGDEDFIVRNLIIAATFDVYCEGALRIACGPGHHISTTGFVWTAIVSAVYFTTMHVQDMKDQAGDRAKERCSAPIILGDSLARWNIAIPVLFCSLFCQLYLDIRIPGCFLPVGIGSIIAVRQLRFREPEDDHTTWVIWLDGYLAFTGCP